MKDIQSDLKNKAISGVLWKGLERVSAQLVSAIVAIILARILSPEDYSVVSIVTIFFAFCNIFISGGLNTALVQKKDVDIIDYSTILITNTFMSVVLYFTMFFLSPIIAKIFSKEQLILIIRVMALTFFINGYKAVLSAKIASELRFKAFFWSTLIGTIISGFIGVYLAINGFGAWSLVLQQMTNCFVDSLILTFTSNIRFKCVFSFLRFRQLFRFGGKIMFSSIINELFYQTKPIIVGIGFSSVELAFFNKGKSYPELITNTANDTLSSAVFPAMTKVQDDKEAILGMVRRFMQLSSFIIFPFMICFASVSEGFVRIVLTDKWLPIIPYLVIFSVANMFTPIQIGNLQVIRALGRSDIYLKLEVIKKLSYFVIIFLFVIFFKDPRMLAISGIVTSLLASIINTYPNKKLIGYGYKKQFQDLGINFVISLLTGIVVFLMKYLPINIYFLTLLQVTSGIIFYILFNILFHNQNFYYFVDTFKGFIVKKKNLD